MRLHFYSMFAFDPNKPCYRPAHGPQDWDTRAWWKPLTFLFCSAGANLPSTSYRLWIYTRWGSMHFDLVFDRRTDLRKDC